MSTMTDYELARLYEEGKDKAFDELLRRHQGQVYTYLVFLVKNEALAEDLLQETFTNVIIAIRSHKYQTTGKFNAWLIRIAHNIAIDHSRLAGAGKTVSKDEFSQSILNNISFSEASCESSFIESQEASRIKELLSYLPETQREVVMMRFYEDMSFKEIADATGVSINTSLGRMRYALINLRKLIGNKKMALVG